MSANYGTANGETNTHTITFRRVEGLKKSVLRLRLDADSVIFHAQAHTVTFFFRSSNEQLSWAILDGVHCIRRIPQQVQDDLLKLHSVAYHGRQAGVKVS